MIVFWKEASLFLLNPVLIKLLKLVLPLGVVALNKVFYLTVLTYYYIAFFTTKSSWEEKDADDSLDLDLRC